MDEPMELAMSHVVTLAPDQLRLVLAHAAGLHADKRGTYATIDALRNIIDALNDTVAARRMEDIAWQVAFDHELTLDQLRSHSRRAYIAHARQEAMYKMRLIRRGDGLHRYSLARIAKFFGLSDHTTVLHGVRAYATRLAMKQQRAAA